MGEKFRRLGEIVPQVIIVKDQKQKFRFKPVKEKPLRSCCIKPIIEKMY
jgi:hypothetical protein